MPTKKSDDARSEVTPAQVRIRRRRAFSAALDEALSVRKVTQTEVAAALHTTQSSVSAWKSGDSIPEEPDIVFELERILHLPPGHLADHLGFVPSGNRRDIPMPVRDSVMADPLLDDAGKRLMMAVYDELVAGAPIKRGRKPRSAH